MQTRHPLAIALVQSFTLAHRTAKRIALRATRELLAPYAVIDCFGTYQLCYTTAEALEWLPACSANARIINRRGKVVARRSLDTAEPVGWYSRA